MKTKFTFLLAFCLISLALQAQTITVESLHTVENFENIDLTNPDIDLESHASVTNNTDQKINLIWKRIVKENCPLEWQTQICDNNLCYFYTVDSNPADKPFELEAGETFDGFIFHALPRTVPGCCRVKVEFSTVENPDVVLETAIFDVSVNTPACDFSTNTKEIEEAKTVSIFPNPTHDRFTLSNNDVVNKIDLYNSLGQKLKTFDFENGEYMDISDLESGIYSIIMINAEGKALSTLMLDKI